MHKHVYSKLFNTEIVMSNTMRAYVCVFAGVGARAHEQVRSICVILCVSDIPWYILRCFDFVCKHRWANIWPAVWKAMRMIQIHNTYILIYTQHHAYTLKNIHTKCHGSVQCNMWVCAFMQVCVRVRTRERVRYVCVCVCVCDTSRYTNLHRCSQFICERTTECTCVSMHRILDLILSQPVGIHTLSLHVEHRSLAQVYEWFMCDMLF